MAETGLKPSRPRKLSEAELAELSRLGSPLIGLLGAWLNKRFTCAHCKRCTRRCEVLTSSALDIGDVEACFERIAGLDPGQRDEAVLCLVQEQPELYHALRQCCFCGHCTATCTTHMAAAERMREWREPLMAAGVMPPDDSRLVMVDNEWHIFSAYRAIHGIAYPEFTQLTDAATGGEGDEDGAGGAAVDTLFFPGCSLASYAPELLRRIGQWFDEAGYRWAMSDGCCGSPLMSAGLFERSKALRHRLLEHVRAAGITRVFTVCPGCGEELAAMMGDEVEILPFPELLLEHLSPGGHGLPGGAATVPQALRKNSKGAGQPGAPPSVTFFDSCHDRFDTRHGTAVRRLLALCLPATVQTEMPHHGKDTLCCGAGGAVAAYDAQITQSRVWRVLDEARATGADTVVTTCPTCTYTIAQALLSAGPGSGQGQDLSSRNYLELVFDQTIDWPLVFGQLEAMWTGEFGPWLTQTFF